MKPSQPLSMCDLLVRLGSVVAMVLSFVALGWLTMKLFTL